MSPETPLDVLINLTQDKLDEAGRNLSELSTRRREAQGQLNTLDGYRADYTRRLQDTTEQGLSASNYHNFRQFIATLDEAISQQNTIIAQIDVRLEAGRKQWHDEKTPPELLRNPQGAPDPPISISRTAPRTARQRRDLGRPVPAHTTAALNPHTP